MDITSLVNILSGTKVTALVNLLSLVSFGLTLLVLVNVRRIRKAYISTARMPDLQKKLKSHATKIKDYFIDFEGNQQLISDELSFTKVTLKSLKTKTNGSINSSTVRLLKEINFYTTKPADDKALRDIYRNVLTLIQEIDDHLKDRKLEPPV